MGRKLRSGGGNDLTVDGAQIGEHIPWPKDEIVKLSPPEPAIVVHRNSQGIITLGSDILPLYPNVR